MNNSISYLRILLTSKCNLSCPYCHREGVTKANSDMKIDEVKEILTACYDVGIRKFKLMGGEPTLYDNLQQMVFFLNSLGNDVDISIISNGLFDFPIIEKCIKLGLNRINISAHAWNEKNAAALGMSVKQLDLMKRNIKLLLEIKKLGKINYVYRNSVDDDELFECIEWINEHKTVIDVLNVLGTQIGKYASMEEIEKTIRNRINIQYEYICYNEHSLPSKRFVLDKGGEINLKVFSLNKMPPFKSCNNCEQLDVCTEGIKAIRLKTDGTIKPCLLRNNNTLFLQSNDNPYNEIKHYLETL